jgi:hypothetical protein
MAREAGSGVKSWRRRNHLQPAVFCRTNRV